MFKLYTRTNSGPVPVKLEGVGGLKEYLKIDNAADDDLLSQLAEVATDFAEQYTRRDIRANTWTLQLDSFSPARICLRRDPIASITSITYLDDADAPQTVASSVYFLKKGVQRSEIILLPDQEWPSLVTDQEQHITVTFVTAAHWKLDQAKLGIKQMVAFLYENRGDCDAREAAKQSGATQLWDLMKIARV